jgi:hypothetical protein
LSCMNAAQLVEYLRGHQKSIPVLRAAVEEEEAAVSDKHYLGWEWDKVRAYPASLMRLVVDGVIRVNYRSSNFTHYLLVDRVATKQALTKLPQ